MKHNKSRDKIPPVAPQLVPVRFELTHPTASSVVVAGTFNQWRSGAETLHSAGDGRWVKETALLPGTYEYCFVVDGHWIPDPLAKETVPNPFGGQNSILAVTGLLSAAHLAEAENLPLNNHNQPKA
jgi:1,4-alpha-glucan branching enzyme